MKKTKLELSKFKIAKLNNLEKFFGGDGTDTLDPNETQTDTIITTRPTVLDPTKTTNPKEYNALFHFFHFFYKSQWMQQES